MAIRTVRFIGGALAVLHVAGCTAWQDSSRTTKGAVYGTAGGAATGAAIGAIVGGGKGAGTGAAIGAVVGGLAGTGMGYYLDKQADEMGAILTDQDSLRRNQEQIDVSMSSDVLFASGSSVVQPGGRDKIARFAGVLNRYPESRIQVIGYTDNHGSDDMNYKLSRDRADAVATILRDNGVASARLSTGGEGESRPLATNDTPEGRAANRRVEIHVVPTQQTANAAPAHGAEPH
jgi:outer membrane protein OmpA-like peptidoglycan-associated protein